MNKPNHTNVLAVDGGGTRCRVALRTAGRVLTAETGSANVTSDFDGGVAQIMKALHALSERAGIGLDALARYPAFVGLAGVTGPEIADRLRAALPFQILRVEDDRLAALRGALGDREGAVAHSGTGSFYAAQIAGTARFSGGWGPVLGDEASAQWVGRTALRLTLEAVDGRAQMTALSETLLAQLGGAAGIVSFGRTARPPEFGALAPMVTQAAQENDPLGTRIMTDGASEIARSLSSIGWQPGLTICLTGGIAPQFQPYLPPEMQVDVAPAAGEPLSGALELACELATEMSS
ncbi:BadF/BadG/BcrA/BcrD ATPase family protein [Shimia sediminis]|uniref:BadF/BadG/BcrA/BcrD ATPase family protein n=1 Tax=Shimia sediminis TaxID=2497945 RepID=UPI000F8DF33A|nr:BadF/BadG/BcrA/BcrD ATPase family protein [Shimia sediminis]